MDLKQVVAAWPLLRSLWRYLPGPFRIPVLVAAGAVWLWQRGRGEDPTGA